MKGIAGKRQPIGNTDRTSRLRSCSKQGVMGAGSVFAQRCQALLSGWTLESAPTFLSCNPTSQIFLKFTPLQSPESQGLS